MAVGGEEGDDEWELDGLLRTTHVDPKEEKENGLMRYREREMICEVTAHAHIVLRPYLLTIEGRDVLSSEHEMKRIPATFAIQNMNLLVQDPQWP